MNKTIVVNSISLVLVSLFCCHGLADEIVLNGGKVEKNSNCVVLAVGPKLMPMDYLMSFFKLPIKMLDIPNKQFDYKFIIKKCAVAPLILYKTSTQIPYLNAVKRITRQANTAKRNIIQANTADGILVKTNIIKSSHIYNNIMNSTLVYGFLAAAGQLSTYIIEFADVSYNSKLCNVLSTSPDYATIRENSNEIKKLILYIKSTLDEFIAMKKNSSEIINNIIALYGFYDWAPYVTIKKHSTEVIDTMLNGVSNWTSYILTVKNHFVKIIDNMLNVVSKRASYSMIKQHMDLIPKTCVYALIGVIYGILLFVAVRANQLRNAQREVIQLPENILIYLV